MKTVDIKVIARASKCEVIPQSDDLLKVKLTRPALEGKANEQLREILAEYFHTAKSKIRIVSGEHATIKRVEIL